MERIFDDKRMDALADLQPSLDGEQVRLHRQHLWLSAAVAENAFAGARQVYSVYYPQRKSLLLAPMSDDAFKTLHECSLVMLKDRNLAGDKSLSLQETIIDHELNGEDRALEFMAQTGLKMLQVSLA